MRTKNILLGMVLALALVSIAAVIKISQFPNTTVAANADMFLLAGSGTNKNITYAQLAAQLQTNTVYGSNALYYANTWAQAPTGALTSEISYREYIAWTPCSVTGFLATAAGTMRFPVLTISNAASTNITLFINAAGVRFVGSSTNALVIPSGKMGHASFLLSGVLWTNCATTTTQ